MAAGVSPNALKNFPASADIMSVIRSEQEPARICPNRTLRFGVRPEVLIWAKQLRANPAPGEVAVWHRLRASQLGFRFRRQAILRGWIADFWCPAKRLVVEVDGWSHRNETRQIKDWVRDSRLSEEFGIKTLRFPVEAVVNNLDRVVDQVRATLASRPTAYIHCTGSKPIIGRRSEPHLVHDGREKLETMTPEEALLLFLELEQERTELSSIKEYVNVMRQLVEIKNALGAAPACTRVRTAIRDLQERLPQIQQMDDQRLKCRTSARIVELERDLPRCPDGHSMVVRQRPNASYFWGCSYFPSCRKTRRLTREQFLQLQH